MSERGNTELLSDIKEAIKRIALYIGKMDAVNYDIVWAIVREELPQQLVKIEEILSKMGLGRE